MAVSSTLPFGGTDTHTRTRFQVRSCFCAAGFPLPTACHTWSLCPRLASLPTPRDAVWMPGRARLSGAALPGRAPCASVSGAMPKGVHGLWGTCRSPSTTFDGVRRLCGPPLPPLAAVWHLPASWELGPLQAPAPERPETRQRAGVCGLLRLVGPRAGPKGAHCPCEGSPQPVPRCPSTSLQPPSGLRFTGRRTALCPVLSAAADGCPLPKGGHQTVPAG